MCLMLYVATTGDQPCFDSALLHVEDVEPHRTAVQRWLTLPVIRFVGAHTGCSCGFRHIIMANEPIDYHEGMFGYEDEQDDGPQATASLSALLAMLRAFVERDGAVELLPTWD